jgi:hypothetical protein
VSVDDKPNKPIVTLRVGPEEMIITAHKDVLIKCGFFAACLKEDCSKEGRKDEVNLPGREPQNVFKLLHWLYSGYTIDVPSSLEYFETNPGRSNSTPDEQLQQHGFTTILVTDYILASRYCAEDVLTTIDEKANGYLLHQCIRWEHLVLLESAGLKNSQLWRTFVRRMALYCVDYDLPGWANLQTLHEEGLSYSHPVAGEILELCAQLGLQ